MKHIRYLLLATFLGLPGLALADISKTYADKINALTPTQKYVTLHDGTEPPFKNKYWNHKEPGIYVDVISGEPLFSSTDKFDSGTGWPSFTKPIENSSVEKYLDKSLDMVRTEVRSSKANAHLGHVFDDGPQSHGGKRFCINSASLRFVHKDNLVKEGYEAYLYLFKDANASSVAQ